MTPASTERYVATDIIVWMLVNAFGVAFGIGLWLAVWCIL